MKLVYCQKCGDVFNLRDNKKTCSCGAVSGKYIDEEHAEVSGEHIALAIGDGSFCLAVSDISSGVDAISDWRSDDRETAILTLYWQMRELVPGIILAWVRPPTGPTNYYTKVQQERKS